MKLFEQIGASVFQSIAGVFYALGYFLHVLRESFLFILHKKYRRVLTFQILFTAVEALPVIAVIAVGLGGIIIVQGVALLPQFGQGDLVYPVLITVITRELGPILTAFIIAARSGTAISTELGNMVVSHEIEAYVASGIDPISYLAVPRFLGVVFSMLLLNLYFNFFGLLGSFLVTTLVTSIDFRYYIFNLMNALRFADIIVSFAKSAVAGAIISIVATYYGFKVQMASTEVPVMAIKSVGRGFILIILSNVFLTVLYYIWI